MSDEVEKLAEEYVHSKADDLWNFCEGYNSHEANTEKCGTCESSAASYKQVYKDAFQRGKESSEAYLEALDDALAVLDKAVDEFFAPVETLECAFDLKVHLKKSITTLKAEYSK